MEPPLKRQRWLSWVGAVLVLLTLFYYIGSWLAVGALAVGFAAFLVYERYRTQRPAKRTSYCLNCGEAWDRNARQCASCGATRWTM